MTTDVGVLPHSTTQKQVDRLVLDILPPQGSWSVEQYLWITDDTNRLIEYTDGYIEVLPMPTKQHQQIVAYFYRLFYTFIQPQGGLVLFAPLRVRIRERIYREPDLLLLCAASDPRGQNRFWLGADLVVEVVSPDKPERDKRDKRHDYAAIHIPEYWIVDPPTATITVLQLEDDAYIEHGVFGRGTQATSALLDGFSVDVGAVFDAS